MADVFLSYAREDLDRAASLAEALKAEGWDVFWDPDIVPGYRWDEVIEKQLAASGCVVVLWSRMSIQSRWVRAEAHAADAKGTLIPVTIDEVQPPVEFGLAQCARLHDWHGDRADARFRSLCRAIEAHCPRTVAAGAAPAVHEESSDQGAIEATSAPDLGSTPLARSQAAKWRWPIVLFAVVLAVLVTWRANQSRSPDPDRPREPGPSPASGAPPGEARAPATPSDLLLNTRAPESALRPTEGCIEFSDTEEQVNHGLITKIDVYHDGFIHAIQVSYGGVAAALHGFTGKGEPAYSFIKHDAFDTGGRRITRIEGEVAPGTEGSRALYVSRLQLFTGGSQPSAAFGTARPGAARFVASGNDDGRNWALRTISGFARIERARGYNRAICDFRFHFRAQ